MTDEYAVKSPFCELVKNNMPCCFVILRKLLSLHSNFGSVVQLVRMLPCHGRGRGFESRPIRKSPQRKLGAFCFMVYHVFCFKLYPFIFAIFYKKLKVIL